MQWITGEQDRAVRVLVDAGFGITTYGASCVRGDPGGPLRPHLPSEPFA